MWVDYRGSLSTVYNDGEISTCGEIWGFHLHVDVNSFVCKNMIHTCLLFRTMPKSSSLITETP